MHVTELLDRATQPLFSYEIIPPQRGGSLQQILATVERLMPFDPPFIDVTSHAAEVVYEELPDGTVRRCTKRKRPGTLGLCAAIKTRFGIESIPHLLCNGFTREETEDALIELHYLGIHNVMALRGDAQDNYKPDRPDRTRNKFAVNLVSQMVAMNQGRYLEELANAEPTNFCIGVAGYPEKHFAAPNLQWDIEKLKQKVDAGAHYVVTQMFFDNQHFFRFVKLCREAGITVPILPGIKILTTKRQLQTIPQNFYVDIPQDLAAEIEAARTEQVAEIGVEWAIRQGEELLSSGVPCLHFYIMSRSEIVTRVVQALRKKA